MAKGIFSSFSTYTRNLLYRTKLWITRQESFDAGWAGLKRDTAKLRRSLGGGTPHSPDHDEAVRLVKQGMQAYNAGRYRDAEEIFRQAIDLDGAYARAHTYLGHALYKSGQVKEARLSWQRAIDAEPDSDAAANARKKLQHLEKSSLKLMQTLHERTKRD